jgi:anaerobic selenocysteine-containing dehydrogenase
MNSTGRRVEGLPPTPYNPCFVHPDDLASLGAAEGDVVTIASDHGSVAAVVAADRRVRRGVVSMTHGHGDLPGRDDDPRLYGTNANALTSADADVQPINAMPQLTAVPVSVERSSDR